MIVWFKFLFAFLESKWVHSFIQSCNNRLYFWTASNIVLDLNINCLDTTKDKYTVSTFIYCRLIWKGDRWVERRMSNSSKPRSSHLSETPSAEPPVQQQPTRSITTSNTVVGRKDLKLQKLMKARDLLITQDKQKQLNGETIKYIILPI